jgi:hypothetical protein
MRHKRVQGYGQKWQEALERNDTDYISKYNCPRLNSTFWANWTQEEKDYYSNTDTFSILKDRKKILIIKICGIYNIQMSVGIMMTALPKMMLKNKERSMNRWSLKRYND